MIRLKSIISVIPTSSPRIPLAQSSRSWRRGVIRAFIVTNDSLSLPLLNTRENNEKHLEFYSSFDDEEEISSGPSRKKPHSKRPGDYRAALSPWLAHKHYKGSYEYMLYGDDDTLFFPVGVASILSRFFHLSMDLSPSSSSSSSPVSSASPSTLPPLAISDNLWVNQAHPHPRSARCLPCSDLMRSARAGALEVVSSQLTDESDRWFLPKLGCGGLGGVGGLGGLGRSGCTPLLACGLDNDKDSLRDKGENHPDCDEKEYLTKAQTGAHGGAGIIFTSTVFKLISMDSIKACYDSDEMLASSGGDSLLSKCLWQHNISFSDPGYWIHELRKTLSTPQSREKVRWNHPDRVFSNSIVFDPSEPRIRSYLASPSALLVSGQCSVTCKWLLRHAVSYHLKGRSMPSMAHATATAWAISESHFSAHDYLTRLNNLTINNDNH